VASGKVIVEVKTWVDLAMMKTVLAPDSSGKRKLGLLMASP